MDGLSNGVKKETKNEKDNFISHGFDVFSFLITGRVYNSCSFTAVKSHNKTVTSAQGYLGKGALDAQARQVEMGIGTLEKGPPL